VGTTAPEATRAAAQRTAGAGSTDAGDLLDSLDALRAAGLLTPEEFDAKRRQLPTPPPGSDPPLA
jgi:hypothetical protein